LGAGGGDSTPTWETIFGLDATFTITPDNTWTIAGNRATATDVVTITNVAGGSGSCLQITNAGSGNDVDGTSNTWSVSKAGAATFVGITPGGDVTSTSTAIDWDLKDNDSSALSFDASGAAGLIEIDTTNSAEVVKFGKSIQVTDGNATFISTSNTVTNVLITNNTITTFGADASSAGVVCIRSTSLTTGSLLQLQLSDTANVGGFYLCCRESVGATNDFTIGENGVLVMAGTAASNSLTMTAGDMVMSDGSLTMTDADNAATLSVTNNTATTASVFVFAGSGVFTGTTTSSFMTITPSGLTTGTAVYLPVAGLTSGTALSIVAATANFTTGGKLLSLDSTAAVAGNHISVATTGAYTGTGMLLMSAGAMTTGVMVSLASTTGLTSGSLLRATSSTAGAIASNGAISFSATGAFTSTSRCGFLNVAANTTTSGTIAHISGTSLTDGTVLSLEAVEATLTTGLYIQCYDGAANDFSVGRYGATTIAGNVSGTAALTLTAGDIVITSGFLVISANAKGVTFTGTGANGGVMKNLKNATASALSGTQKDIEIDIEGTPYYFTVYPTKA
jgi:hypothetical protein